jgi:hypothetical protein
MLKLHRIIDGNQKNKFKRKHIVNVTFSKKEYCKGDVLLLLNITNS